MSDFATGPVIDKPKPAYVRPTREPELYKGEPPQNNDGKTPQVFTIQQRCDIEDIDFKTKKKSKCQQRLQVVRVKNQVFEKDESGFGGQIIYDEKEIRQYIQCPTHGGLKKKDDQDWHFDRWEPGQSSKL